MSQTMKNLIKPFDENDFAQYKQEAHSLKGASGYIGAGKIHYMCYFIQQNYFLKRYERMKRYYPNLIEAVIEFKVYSRQLICQFNNSKYEVAKEHQTTFFSKQFNLKKDPMTGYIYCVKKGQTISERKKEITQLS